MDNGNNSTIPAGLSLNSAVSIIPTSPHKVPSNVPNKVSSNAPNNVSNTVSKNVPRKIISQVNSVFDIIFQIFFILKNRNQCLQEIKVIFSSVLSLQYNSF